MIFEVSGVQVGSKLDHVEHLGAMLGYLGAILGHLGGILSHVGGQVVAKIVPRGLRYPKTWKTFGFSWFLEPPGEVWGSLIHCAGWRSGAL